MKVSQHQHATIQPVTKCFRQHPLPQIIATSNIKVVQNTEKHSKINTWIIVIYGGF